MSPPRWSVLEPRGVRMPRSFLIAVLFASLNLVPTRADDLPLRDFIDVQVKAAWTREKLDPAPRADDAAFLRRVYLDLCGTIPSADEAAAFIKDAAADKRARLIDKLL